jgi:hypothetical protein
MDRTYSDRDRRFLVLYGVEFGDDIETALALARRFIELSGLRITQCSISQLEYEKHNDYRPRTRSQIDKVWLKIKELGISKLRLFSFEEVYGDISSLTNKAIYINVKRKIAQFELIPNEHEQSFIVRLCHEFAQSIPFAYGFSDVLNVFRAHNWPVGIGMTDSTPEENCRIDELGDSIYRTHAHLKGQIHDVYSLNVLSRKHRDWPVGSSTLEHWIRSGDNGSIKEISSDIVLWCVDSEIRPRVRKALLDMGALIVSV